MDLPFRLHKGTNWVPPLKLERYGSLSRRFNPLFKHGDAQLFLAWREGRVVGRISAQYDTNFNDFHHNRWGFFGFIEFEDDQEIVDGLLAAAEQWLRDHDRDRMMGPFDFIINEECGLLIEGYDEEPMIRQPWHPPYYRERLEASGGFIKAMDVLHWKLPLDSRETTMLPRLEEAAVIAREKHGITISKMSFWRLGRDFKEFGRIYEAAWSKNWAFSPYDAHDIADLAMTYRLIFDRDWFMLARNEQGEAIAACITIPDVNQILRKMKGHIFPTGWWHYLRRKHTINRVRIGFLGVLPEYELTGVAAQLYIENYDMGAKRGVSYGEPGWILETNHSMNRGAEAMGGTVTKRMRIYERLLEPDAQPSAPPESVKRYQTTEQRRAQRAAKAAG